MGPVDKQVLRELEFDELREILASFTQTLSAKEKALELGTFQNNQALRSELKRVSEMKSLLEYDNLPAFSSNEIIEELSILRIQNAVLPERSIQKLGDICAVITQLKQFFSKKKELYPQLTLKINQCQARPEINLAIDLILDRQGRVKDSASNELEKIRRSQERVQQQMNRAFAQVLERLHADGWLSDTKESFVGGRRVLSVLSEYKRKVSGHILGLSNTGKVSYIEPSQTIQLNNEWVILENEERIEINRILHKLCEYLRSFLADFELYQKLIVQFDLLRAKGKLAIEMNGNMPEFSDQMEISLVEAYHPLLYLKNKERKIKTIAQSIKLDPDKRLLVISGPNAGGKTITLKTVGLIQLMLQSGLLIPCREYSRLGFFKQIMTDIGDNQSIDNELSTYSYRLKQMKLILDKAGRQTLVLMDEFGTGSDPELGGALASVFFKDLHTKGCFGVLTTHYGPIKSLASTLPGVLNACMLFDLESLSPLYELSVGQPGSSFTFEVAEKIGLSKKLITEAKKLVKIERVNWDHDLAVMQKSKAKIEALRKELEQMIQQNQDLRLEMNQSMEENDERWVKLNELQRSQSKLISLGKKMQHFLDSFPSQKKDQKAWLDQILKFAAIERARLLEDEKKIQSEIKARTSLKKSTRNQSLSEKKKIVKELSLGCQVKMIEGTVVGVVTLIDKDNISVRFGDFLTKVKRDKLLVL